MKKIMCVTLVNRIPVATREIWPILDVDQSSHSMLLSSFEIGEFSIPIEIRLIEYYGRDHAKYVERLSIHSTKLSNMYIESKGIIIKMY